MNRRPGRLSKLGCPVPLVVACWFFWCWFCHMSSAAASDAAAATSSSCCCCCCCGCCAEFIVSRGRLRCSWIHQTEQAELDYNNQLMPITNKC